jgi:tetratricopeptide (TPR) repeat protein
MVSVTEQKEEEPNDRYGLILTDTAVSSDLRCRSVSRPCDAQPMKERHDGPEIARLSGLPFVGRKQELFTLQRAVEGTLCGGGALVMLEGEPGIGKTRLAGEFASVAQNRGARVLWGRCDGGISGAPVLWPWIQIARQQSSSCLPEEPNPNSNGELAKLAGEIWRLASERPELGGALAVRPEVEIFMDAMLGMLSQAARSFPVVVIVDDVSRADPLSLEVLGLVAKELCGSAILIVASYHDGAFRNASALPKTFAELALTASHRIELRGLDESELAELVDAQTGRKAEPRAVHQLARMSGGNPRFVELILHQWLATSPVAEHQGGVRVSTLLRAAVERHLEPLPEPLRELLTVAAVSGPEFELGVLKQVCDDGSERLLDAIDAAQMAGLIIRIEDAPDRYRFVHTLVRDALCEDLSGVERAHLHRRIGTELARLHPLDPRYFGDVAHHLFESASGGVADIRLVEYCNRAGNYAETLGRLEEASRFYEMALSALDLMGAVVETKRCDLLLALGKAQRRQGRGLEALQTLARAAQSAEGIGDFHCLARVALAMAGEIWTVAMGSSCSPQTKILLERSLLGLGDEASPLKAMVCVRLAAELWGTTRGEKRRLALLKQATRIAKRSGDAEALLAVECYRHVNMLSRPDRIDDRLANAEQLCNKTLALSDHEDWGLAFSLRYSDLLRKGEVMRADAEAARISHAAGVTRNPLIDVASAGYATVRAFIDGRFEEGERSAWQFLRAKETSCPEVVALFLPSMVVPLRELDRLGEIEAFATRTIEQQPWLLLLRAVLAQIRLGLGDTEGARLLFEEFAAHGFDELPDNISLSAYLAILAELCVEFGDRERAATLYELLSPYSELNVVLGQLAFLGPASRYLGILATMLGRFEEAERHLLSALRLSSRTAARPWIAYTRYDYGQMLLARDEAGDRELALSVATTALDTAQALGMRALARRAALLKTRVESLNGPMAAPTGVVGQVEPAAAAAREIEIADESAPTPREPDAEGSEQEDRRPHTNDMIFRRHGDYWTIVFEGKLLRLKHCKGLSIIGYLLRHPGEEFLASALESLAVGGDPMELRRISDGEKRELRASTVPVGGSTPLLDATAKVSYARRLRELHEELEEAGSFNDLGRVAKIEKEIEFLTRELASAAGRGGRDRNWASEIERYRVNVTNAVRSVIRKIRPEHTSLARYLAAAIKTGRFCSFHPDRSFPDPWTV